MLSVLYARSSVCVWDIRGPKVFKATEEKNLSGIPTTFKHLDLTWKPHLKVSLTGFSVRTSLMLTTYVSVIYFVLAFSAKFSQLLGLLLSVIICGSN